MTLNAWFFASNQRVSVTGQRITPTGLLILVTLADCCYDEDLDGATVNELDYIADRCAMDEATLRGELKTLMDNGFLEKLLYRDEFTGKRGTLYKLVGFDEFIEQSKHQRPTGGESK